MTAIIDAPRTFERGTSPDRHPWFLTDNAGGRNLPPDCRVTSFQPDSPDPCPGCGGWKEGVCGCGYDWENACWPGAPVNSAHGAARELRADRDHIGAVWS